MKKSGKRNLFHFYYKRAYRFTSALKSALEVRFSLITKIS